MIKAIKPGEVTEVERLKAKWLNDLQPQDRGRLILKATGDWFLAGLHDPNKITTPELHRKLAEELANIRQVKPD